MNESPERFVLARRGLPLPLASHATLRGAWLPAAARSERAPEGPRATQVASTSAPAPVVDDEPWWMEASAMGPVDTSDRGELPAPAPAPVTRDAAPPAAEIGRPRERDHSDIVTHIVEVPVRPAASVQSSAEARRSDISSPRTQAAEKAPAARQSVAAPASEPPLQAPVTVTQVAAPVPPHTAHAIERLARREQRVETTTVVIQHFGGAPSSERGEARAAQTTAPVNNEPERAGPAGVEVVRRVEQRVESTHSPARVSAMGVPQHATPTPTTATRPDLTPLLAPPRRAPADIRIDRIAVTIQTPPTRPVQPGQPLATPASAAVAPAERAYRNPWSSYFARRD